MNEISKQALAMFIVGMLLVVFVTVVHERGHSWMVEKEYSSCNPKIWYSYSFKGDYVETHYDVPASCISRVSEFKISFAGFWLEIVVSAIISLLLILFLFFGTAGLVHGWKFWALFITLVLLISILYTLLFYINPFHVVQGDMQDMISLVNST